MNTEQEKFKPATDDVTKVWTGFGYLPRQVVCAANNYDGFVVLGVRHFCRTMNATLDKLNMKGSEPHEQGFVDQWGNFMDRTEALLVLQTNGRFIRDDSYDDILFSENLY